MTRYGYALKLAVLDSSNRMVVSSPKCAASFSIGGDASIVHLPDTTHILAAVTGSMHLEIMVQR